MRSGLSPIKDVLKTVFAELDRQKNCSREDVEARWLEIAGKTAARHSRPVTLRKSVLAIWVDSPAWMHELSLRKRTLLKRLKSVFGKDRIAQIQFKIGEI